MSEVLMLFLEANSYTPVSDSTKPFNNTMFGELVGADVGHPLTDDGEAVQSADVDDMIDEVIESDLPAQTSTTLHERYCVTEPKRFSGDVKLRSGELVRVDDYDVVLVSLFWMYYGYVRYLGQNFPQLRIVGIQEESLMDVISCSPQLQLLQREALASLDAFIAGNCQYRNWVAPQADDVLLQPTPVPADHYLHVEPKPRSDRGPICVGTGTANMDFENLYTNLLITDHLRAKDYPVDAEIIGLKEYQHDRFGPFADELEYVTFTEYLDDDYYEYIAGMKLGVSLSTRATTDRTAADFAAVGVPRLGTPDNEYQRRCFPDLCVAPFDTERACTLAEKLLTDEDFYDQVQRTASRRLETLTESDQLARKIQKFVFAES